MKAAVLYRPKVLKFEDREVPSPNPDEVLIKVKNVGICRSDVHYYVHGRIGSFIVKEPIILGHECSGEIVDKGKNVKDLEIGDRVIVEPGAPCRKCFYCKIGRYNLCDNIAFMGTPPTDGAFREYLTWPSDFVYKMPEGMTFEEGALIEPFSVGVYAVRRAGLLPGNSVAILGAGTIGLMTLLAAREAGASEIFITDIADHKLKLAKKFGAQKAINAKEEDVIESIMSLTNGFGVDIVFDAVGIEQTINQAIRIARKGGKVVIIGLGFEDLTATRIIDIPIKELDVLGIMRYVNVYRDAMKLAFSKKIPLQDLITHRLSFGELVRGMEIMEKDGENAIKIMIKVS